MYVGIDLASAPLDTALLLVDAPESSRQRLSSLGLRVGSRFSLLSRTAGGGRVAMVSGSRIALGASLVKQLRAEVGS
ncbi:MAG TPA: FeoA domain-containing protein [Propionicimonas sp.]|nr:FeoA domain-containing protein [Propionicimonas sp.]HRA07530.1 FeoA domain-containing protein [Propionicimonas sp.]